MIGYQCKNERTIAEDKKEKKKSNETAFLLFLPKIIGFSTQSLLQLSLKVVTIAKKHQNWKQINFLPAVHIVTQKIQVGGDSDSDSRHMNNTARGNRKMPSDASFSAL